VLCCVVLCCVVCVCVVLARFVGSFLVVLARLVFSSLLFCSWPLVSPHFLCGCSLAVRRRWLFVAVGFCLVLFWSSWGSFGIIWGRLGGRFGTFWIVLGAVLALLTPLGVLLAPSWDVLGRSGRRLTAISPKNRRIQNSGAFFLRFLAPSWVPKGAKTKPKTTKNRSKNRLKKRSHFRTV